MPWRQRVNKNTNEKRILEGECPYCHCNIDGIVTVSETKTQYWDFCTVNSNGEILMEDELDRAEGSPKITEFRCPECDRELTREEVEQIFNVKLLDRYFEE